MLGFAKIVLQLFDRLRVQHFFEQLAKRPGSMSLAAQSGDRVEFNHLTVLDEGHAVGNFFDDLSHRARQNDGATTVGDQPL
jgi:hypothetical protein